MTHDEAHLLLLDLAYGELDDEKAGEVHRHAGTCAACGAELDAIAAARTFAARKGDGVAPARRRRELVDAARLAVSPPRRRWSVRPRTAALAAAAAVIAIVGGVTLRVLDDRSRRVVEDGGAPASEAAPPPQVQPEIVAPPRSAATQRQEPAPAAQPAPAPARRLDDGAGRTAGQVAGDTAGRLAAPEHRAPPRPASPGLATAPAPAPIANRAASGHDDQETAAKRSSAAAPRSPVRARQVMADVERRAAAGELSTEQRRIACGETDVDRTALVAPGARIVKLTIRRDDRLLVEGWYDQDGVLQALRTHDPDGASATSFPDEASHAVIPRELPERAPALESLGSHCTW